MRQHRYPLDAPVKVYPNLLEVRKYELLARRDQLFEIGLKNARRLGEGTEFERLRDYERDDDYRRINWPATARLHKPITTDYQPERSQSVIIMLDAGRLMTAPLGPLSKLDYAINTTLLLAYVAILRGDRVGLLTFADTVMGYWEPDKGRRQFLAILEALYKVQPQQVEADYMKAGAFLSAQRSKRSLVVLFTDIIDRRQADALVRGFGRLAPRHLPYGGDHGRQRSAADGPARPHRPAGDVREDSSAGVARRPGCRARRPATPGCADHRRSRRQTDPRGSQQISRIEGKRTTLSGLRRINSRLNPGGELS